ncbi:class I SAM-dependent methyltransferase [Thiohalocapsa marina]|uniref:Class I SAM-dependent methyltransferase n=1 Tax=Thiohalocapsa marina TaxID=424902 RepID=A0A5M8FU31_9GAMM|nr:methyltransferase domain-containing protein [Thiohalocapsa marina]KAA6187305.1 class I SAM-dependent methyltransferase [Thiohalocapsa marina]
MDVKELAMLGEEVDHHWYYRAKAKAMMAYLGKASPELVLDVGAGSGFFSKYLLSHTSAAQALCVDINYERETDVLVCGKKISYRRSAEDLEADLVLFMDVLEHVDDDVGLLRSYVENVPAQTRFLISVPAFQWLWSGHDEFLEHRRRYTLQGLEAIVAKSGLVPVQGAYFYGLLLPIAVVPRLLQKLNVNHDGPRNQLKRHHPYINKLLEFVCDIELPLMRHNRIAGLTAFCLAVKPTPKV